MIVYRIDNAITGDLYVGMTSKTVAHRFKQHLLNARSGYRTHLCRAIRHYGEDAFSVSIIEECEDRNILAERERFWIKTLAPQYNMTAGGDGGDTSSSPAFVAAMAKRDFWKEKNPMFGKRKILSPHFGKRHSEDTKETMRISANASWVDAEERREKAKARMLANPASAANAKKVVFEGVEYSSLASASRTTGRSHWYIKKHGFIS